jgi:dihydroorotase (multifunctional complex type)
VADFDLAILGGTLVTARGRARQHLYIRDGQVAAVTPERHRAEHEVEAEGLYVLPGMVDTHVHLMDPGAPEREDFPTGTAAAAAGGVTTIVEHTHARPVRSAPELREKLAHLAEKSNVDYGLAAHVWPDRLGHLPELWRAGVTFFKAFTCTTHGVPGLDAAHLQAAFGTLGEFDGPCLVHCEDESLTAQAERVLTQAGRRDPGVLSEWRSREAELVASTVACVLAELTGARIAIAHVSHPAVASIIARSRAAGATIGAEACPQYFLLREHEVLERGAFRKFTPPARARSDGDESAMWELLRQGVFSHVATDHAPATPAQKEDGDIWEVHFGLPGLDTTLALLVTAALNGRLSLEDVVARYALQPARWYGLYPRKGHLGVGADADFSLLDPTPVWTVRDEAVISKAGWSPYTGIEACGWLVATYLRGERVAADRAPFHQRTGRFLPGPGAASG